MTAIATAPIRAATPADLRQVTEILAAAFHAGDLAPWLVPGPVARARIYPPYFEILAEHALDVGHVDLVDDVAVAVWYALGEDPQIDIPDYDRRLSAAVGQALPRFVALDNAMHDNHPAGRAHHDLAFLAARPGQQGHGYGSLLLRHHLQELDADGMPSYLDATGDRNARLYRRYGYISRPPYAVDGDSSPLLYPMWRDACPELSPRSATDPPLRVP